MINYAKMLFLLPFDIRGQTLHLMQNERNQEALQIYYQNIECSFKGQLIKDFEQRPYDLRGQTYTKCMTSLLQKIVIIVDSQYLIFSPSFLPFFLLTLAWSKIFLLTPEI